jgi:hypothetical protein
LHGLFENRCPECGDVFDPVVVATLQRARPSWTVRIGTTAAAFVTLSVAAFVAISAPIPRLYSPFPFLVILPYFLSGGKMLAVLSPQALLLPWIATVGVSRVRVPWWSTSLFALLAVFNAAWCVLGFRFSLGYHGVNYTVGVVLLNAIWLACAAALWWRNRWRPSRAGHVGYCIVVSLWLCWFAFPYLGELP